MPPRRPVHGYFLLFIGKNNRRDCKPSGSTSGSHDSQLLSVSLKLILRVKILTAIPYHRSRLTRRNNPADGSLMWTIIFFYLLNRHSFHCVPNIVPWCSRCKQGSVRFTVSLWPPTRLPLPPFHSVYRQSIDTDTVAVGFLVHDSFTMLLPTVRAHDISGLSCLPVSPRLTRL